ncbi:MCE family protein [Actinophytocola oryzae]|uniref:Phospholipid/cholesterol/gamma-HCH transport system substrate-binding protein n=1 Tax=Actinophytocola oryzae TaxID=502181 RepID=A0A4R7V9G6_9PSEU|nr:MlaD family protein [Actinophytocola oryzae]TDV45564.1 phospholipid/cholesterol/gamma-HCH transport system substrate-binding protein [Actinophytocola oryzae]
MLTRRVRIQLIAFAVIAVVAIVYAAFRFTDVGKVFGADGYTVKMNLKESGGIFTNAEVTYRGFNVGRVGEIHLTHDGIQVDLNIDSDAPRIPEDLDAVVANRSAVGEQYVDLRPRDGDGPYLSGASVISADRTVTPVGTDTVIRDLDSLASSVPTDSLRTVVDELDEAFAGTGDDLQVLLDSTRDFTTMAREHLPQTITLIDDGGSVLDTQNAQAGNITSFANSLHLLSDQLKSSDPDLRNLITQAPRVASQVTDLLAESGPGLGVTVANLLTTSDILRARKDGLEYAFVAYPLFSAAGQGLLGADPGQVHLGLVLNLFNPPPCTKGYEQTPRRNGTDIGAAPQPVPEQTYCAEPTGSPVNVRGSANAPFGGVPVAQDQPATPPGGGSDAARNPLAVLPGSVSQPGGDPLSLATLLGLPG